MLSSKFSSSMYASIDYVRREKPVTLCNIHRVQIKRCHWFFCCNFYKYWRIFIIFREQLHERMPKYWRKNFLPYFRYVATIPCESLKHKSNTFHTNISTLHMFISITCTETSNDETNKTQQKVRGSKFMFKTSTIHGNTCIQTTTPLRNHCRNDGVVQQPPLPQQTFFQLLHIMDPRSVDPLLKDTPDAVVHRIQIWRIRWPHLWRDELWRLSLSLQHGAARPAPSSLYRM